MFLRATAPWDDAEAALYGKEYISMSVDDIFMTKERNQQGWTLGTRLRDHAKGWFPAQYVEEINRLDINPSFIVDIHFHLACAVADNQNLMLQLVLPPEYYTLKSLLSAGNGWHCHMASSSGVPGTHGSGLGYI